MRPTAPGFSSPSLIFIFLPSRKLAFTRINLYVDDQVNLTLRICFVLKNNGMLDVIWSLAIWSERLVVRKLSDVRVAKNPRLRSWRYSERIWCYGVIQDFQVFTSSASTFDSCVYGPDFSSDFICVVSWGFDKHLDKFKWVWRTVLWNLTLFQEEAWSEFRETNIEV